MPGPTGSVGSVEAWHTVGGPGQSGYLQWSPLYLGGPDFWTNYRSASFYIDPVGTVHLAGVAFFDSLGSCFGQLPGAPLAPGVIFNLPADHRPEAPVEQVCQYADADSPAGALHTTRCEVLPNGDVSVPDVNQCQAGSGIFGLISRYAVQLDGVTFRAGAPTQCSGGALSACTGLSAGAACTLASAPPSGGSQVGTCELACGGANLACQPAPASCDPLAIATCTGQANGASCAYPVSQAFFVFDAGTCSACGSSTTLSCH